jgi:hypothetical protein
MVAVMMGIMVMEVVFVVETGKQMVQEIVQFV